MTFPVSFTILAARNTSIPAPESKSTTALPSIISANLVWFPQPTPNTEDSGMDSNYQNHIQQPLMIQMERREFQMYRSNR